MELDFGSDIRFGSNDQGDNSMRLRNIPGARETIAESRWIVQDPASLKGKWRERFGNGGPLHLEIGTGKGRFINQLAQENPGINYVGIEKYSSVLIRALDKLDESGIENLLFIRGDAQLICEYFDEGEVDRIYLNFSDPWPKDRHAKRRLPSKEFLRRFAQILSKDGTIEFKTDNRALFDFAVEEVEAGGFEITAITYDLHNDPVMNEGNIMTEYEERFSAKGNPICKYILKKK
jgi:tRNA (guanine-N7-)-methyltransferase